MTRQLACVVLAVIAITYFPMLTAAPTERQRQGCKSTADKFAQALMKAKKEGVPIGTLYVDNETGKGERITNYMIHTANTSSVTERELALLGYTYCLSQF